MKQWMPYFLSLSLLLTGLQPAHSQSVPNHPRSESAVMELGPDSREFRRELVDLNDSSRQIVYSLENIDAVANDLENVDKIVLKSISEKSARIAVERLSSAIDLYTAILLDQRIKGEEKINYTSALEGGIYQAFISLLRHYGADPLDPKTREIPQRNIVRKIIHEMMIDVRSLASRSRDAFGERVYSPFEKLYRDQATQKVIAKLQNLALQSHTTQDGDGGMIAENSRDMMKEIAIDNSVKTVNDRRAAQWITTGTYGVLAVVSFFVIVDYVGLVDGILGGAGRTEVSQLVTGVINFSILSSVAILKAASIRGHVRAMVLNLQDILKDPKNFENRTPIRRSLATWLFRKRIDFDQELQSLNEFIPKSQGGGGRVRCNAAHAQ